MTRDDIAALVTIETESFPTPWTENNFAVELDNPFARFFVYDDGGTVVGYYGAWRVVDEWDIADIAVRADRRRQGIGRALLEHLLATARAEGVRDVTLEVRPSNIAARALYEAFGFCEEGRRPRYYLNGEDALILWRRETAPEA